MIVQASLRTALVEARRNGIVPVGIDESPDAVGPATETEETPEADWPVR